MNSSSYYESAPPRSYRRWLIVAFIASLALHLFLLDLFKKKELEGIHLGPPPERLAPNRSLTVKRVTISEDHFQPAEEEAPPKKVVTSGKPTLRDIPQEKPSLSKLPDKVKLSPLTPEASVKPLLDEKPGAIKSDLSELAPKQSNTAIERELDSVRRELATKVAPRISESQVPLPSADGREGDSAVSSTGARKPGFSNLDELLAHSGPLSGQVAPVNMPGGALFAYDSAELHPDAIRTLEKLAELIKRNPRATFSIEGHTDSIGNPDYNQYLSEQRALAVKAWLIERVGIAPERIETRGFGSSRLIVPATGNPDEEQPNRRVEIVIRTPKD